MSLEALLFYWRAKEEIRLTVTVPILKLKDRRRDRERRNERGISSESGRGSRSEGRKERVELGLTARTTSSVAFFWYKADPTPNAGLYRTKRRVERTGSRSAELVDPLDKDEERVGGRAHEGMKCPSFSFVRV